MTSQTQTPIPRTELQALAHDTIEELWDARENPLVATPDIDMVWVLSAPGTVYDIPDAAPYEGVSFNMNLIDWGVRIVRDVTAVRLGKEPEDVTKEDIEQAGPVLFYNGEDETTRGNNYPNQNNHLAELIANPDFPIPASKVKIDHIDIAHTPSQIEGIAEYLKTKDTDDTKKIAVVSGFQHSPRVGRYIEHYKDLLPEGVDFVNAPAGQSHNESTIAGLEARKVLRYFQIGHLARESVFGTPEKTNRPHQSKGIKPSN